MLVVTCVAGCLGLGPLSSLPMACGRVGVEACGSGEPWRWGGWQVGVEDCGTASVPALHRLHGLLYGRSRALLWYVGGCGWRHRQEAARAVGCSQARWPLRIRALWGLRVEGHWP